MKFGSLLRSQMLEGWEAYYVEYDMMKEELTKLAESAPSARTSTVTSYVASARGVASRIEQLKSTREIAFMTILDRELSKVSGFAVSKARDIQTRVTSVLRRVSRLTVTPETASQVLDGLSFATKEVDAIAEDAVRLDTFSRQNCIAMEKIAKKHDKQFGSGSRHMLQARLLGEPIFRLRLDGFTVPISDAYSRLRNLRNKAERAQAEGSGDGDEAGGVWVPPESFERDTTKYWVRMADLLRVKMLIVRHLPVLLFGRDSNDEPRVGLRDAHEEFTDVDDGAMIASVYLDNDSLGSYHTRLERREGANLVRIRWYGTLDAGSGPGTGGIVYVERKTHHESWTQEKSKKERFPIRSGDVKEFLEGSYDVVPFLKERVKAGEMKQEALEKACTLARETQELTGEFGLRPAVRTAYRRTAFQLSSSNAVRISVDAEMQFMNETLPKRGHNWFVSAADATGPRDQFFFEYAILEIKLQEAAPAWVDELLASGMLMPVRKFSKFLSACALVHPRLTQRLPHWFNEDGSLQPWPTEEERADMTPGELAVHEQLIASTGASGAGAAGAADAPVGDTYRGATPALPQDVLIEVWFEREGRAGERG